MLSLHSFYFRIFTFTKFLANLAKPLPDENGTKQRIRNFQSLHSVKLLVYIFYQLVHHVPDILSIKIDGIAFVIEI